MLIFFYYASFSRMDLQCLKKIYKSLTYICNTNFYDGRLGRQTFKKMQIDSLTFEKNL